MTVRTMLLKYIYLFKLSFKENTSAKYAAIFFILACISFHFFKFSKGSGVRDLDILLVDKISS